MIIRHIHLNGNTHIYINSIWHHSQFDVPSSCSFLSSHLRYVCVVNFQNYHWGWRYLNWVYSKISQRNFNALTSTLSQLVLFFSFSKTMLLVWETHSFRYYSLGANLILLLMKFLYIYLLNILEKINRIHTAEHSKYSKPFDSAKSFPTFSDTLLLPSRSILLAKRTPEVKTMI